MSDEQNLKLKLKSLAEARDMLCNARSVLDEVRSYNDAGVDTAVLRPFLLVLAIEVAALRDVLLDFQKHVELSQRHVPSTDKIQ